MLLMNILLVAPRLVLFSPHTLRQNNGKNFFPAQSGTLKCATDQFPLRCCWCFAVARSFYEQQDFWGLLRKLSDGSVFKLDFLNKFSHHKVEREKEMLEAGARFNSQQLFSRVLLNAFNLDTNGRSASLLTNPWRRIIVCCFERRKKTLLGKKLVEWQERSFVLGWNLTRWPSHLGVNLSKTVLGKQDRLSKKASRRWGEERELEHTSRNGTRRCQPFRQTVPSKSSFIFTDCKMTRPYLSTT